ncbi:hypothetical protein DB771_06145 [Burkholderia sp. AU29985]|nr:hypothetical protein XM57_06155 [Burkholderia cepacia]AYZ97311.1 hypothetical protein EGY28_20000 [Burkholderia dolosa]ETP66763.1 hypothetical protein BDSB_02705 [Burkholderia dolosa PC543]PRE52793.1 hypothetical protein C6P87_07800 [Burkholderia sp. AU12872]PUA77664.1 hypothetical protein DB771_06145 [Burkholderia sp. AU29985]
MSERARPAAAARVPPILSPYRPTSRRRDGAEFAPEPRVYPDLYAKMRRTAANGAQHDDRAPRLRRRKTA